MALILGIGIYAVGWLAFCVFLLWRLPGKASEWRGYADDDFPFVVYLARSTPTSSQQPPLFTKFALKKSRWFI